MFGTDFQHWCAAWMMGWYLSLLSDQQIRELTFTSVGKIDDVPSIPGI